jgi:7 transmembrane receptor (rhodopsin family)
MDSISQIWIIFVATIFGLISFIGVIGNALVIYVILSKRQMRTVTNILLLNLAIADLCFVLIVPPMTAYTIIHDSKWWLGLVACKLMHYVTNVSGYVTVYTLVLVSAVRYMTVVHGVTTARLRTIRNVVIMIVTIWVTMLAANSPILSAYELRNLNDR